jgi:predicted TIM-barrel fold metal-dependent hydrolase
VYATTTVAQPRLCAAIMGTLVKGLGADRIVWGTDAVWTGAPQWQIEGLRRLEIPEDMQAKFGFAPLGPATGPVKSAILGENSARLYGIEPAAYAAIDDRLAAIKRDYLRAGGQRSNLRYGYVARG